MPQSIDPRYTFNFVGPDGKRYQRRIYWERLYAFFPDRDPVLAAGGMVPRQNLHHALFHALRKKGKQINLLPETSGDGESSDFISSVTEMIHYRTSSSPAKIIEDAKEGLGETFEQVRVEYGMRNWPGYVPDSVGDPSAENAFTTPTALLDLLADITAEDAGWFNLSYRVDALIKEQVQHMRETPEPNVKTNALVRRQDLEDDLYKRLYGNPKYLEFVKRVMDARGGYASPLVNHFLSFYAKCLNQKIGEYIRREKVDTAFMRERLEGVLGKAEAESMHVLPAHRITILGHVIEGHLSPNKADPENTGKSFQVDPDIELQEIVCKEIEDRLSRTYIRGFVRFIFGKNHHIKSLSFLSQDN